MYRHTTVRVWAIAALALGALLPGCVTQDREGREPTIETAIINNTDMTIRASLHAGERVRLKGAPITPIKSGQAKEITRGQTRTITMSRPRSWGFALPEPDDELVFWLRLEVITASWEEDSVHWFEALGPPPKLVTVTAPADAERVELLATSDTVPIQPARDAYEPYVDRSPAFRQNDPAYAGAGERD